MTKVLLVEDDNNLREIFEMRLQAEGYTTSTAGDGEEALTVALKEKPELIISDVMMPKLSGFEMLENLRAAPEMANTKVIMMTALGQAEDRARGEKLGVVKYLVKSQVTLEDFVRVVREVLNPEQAAAASTPATNPVPPGQAQPLNNQESGASMPEDTQPTNPAAPSTPPADNSGAAPSSPASNPISDPSAASANVSSTGQMSSAEEQSSVQGQINDFVSSAPAGPAEPASDPMPGLTTPGAGGAPADDAGTPSTTEGPAVPPTTAPGAGEPPQDPAQPGQNPGGAPPDPSSGL